MYKKIETKKSCKRKGSSTNTKEKRLCCDTNSQNTSKVFAELGSDITNLKDRNN